MTTSMTAEVGQGSKEPTVVETYGFRDRLMHFEADKTLMDAAREIGPLIREHADEAERERRLSKPVLEALKETGLLKMATIPRWIGVRPDHSRARRRRGRSSRLCGRVDIGKPGGLGFLLCASPRRRRRGNLRQGWRRGDRRSVWTSAREKR